MRVALDAGPLALSSGGLRRYVEELSLALATHFPDDRLVLMSDRPFTRPDGSPANLTAAPAPRNVFHRRWWLYGARRACASSQVALFHGTNFTAPYHLSIPSVVTVHDLSPWMDPAWHAGADRVRTRSPYMIRHALLTLTPSETIRRQTVEHFKLPPDRVIAVPLAASPHFRPIVASPGPPYFLFVGTLEPRKNLPALIDAWRGSTVPLKIAGRRRADFYLLPDEPGLEWLGEVPEAALPALYSGALAVIYPSLYEGFGLPVLEAMQCGACVITSQAAALLELAGDAALTFQTPAELRILLTTLAQDPPMALPWKERALARAAHFSWANTARRTREVYQEALARAR